MATTNSPFGHNGFENLSEQEHKKINNATYERSTDQVLINPFFFVGHSFFCLIGIFLLRLHLLVVAFYDDEHVEVFLPARPMWVDHLQSRFDERSRNRS